MTILGLATSGAQTALPQTTAAALAIQTLGMTAPDAATLQALYRISGIQSRHTVLDGGMALDSPTLTTQSPAVTSSHSFEQFFPPRNDSNQRGPTTAERLSLYPDRAAALATKVCREALQQSRCEPSRITQLVTVSCTGFSAPGFDLALFSSLELRPDTQRTHIGFMGCNAALNGLRVANALASQGETVLLVCVELCSLHFSYDTSPEQLVANSLFSDGAAAVVIGPSNQRIINTTDRGRIAASGSFLIPDSADAMSWNITDNGFRMTLSPHVPGIIERALPALLPTWLQQQGISIKDVGGWGIHPGGTRILEASRRALGLEREALLPSRTVLQNHGNMSSPTVLFVAQELLRDAIPFPWVLLAFGPGLVAEFCVIESSVRSLSR